MTPSRTEALRSRDGDGHAADRIDGLLYKLGRRRAARVPPGDELGEDRDGDLLLRGPEVEAGRAAHSRERLLVHPAREASRHGGTRLFALATSPT